MSPNGSVENNLLWIGRLFLTDPEFLKKEKSEEKRKRRERRRRRKETKAFHIYKCYYLVVNNHATNAYQLLYGLSLSEEEKKEKGKEKRGRSPLKLILCHARVFGSKVLY